MRVRDLHPWDLSPRAAVDIQLQLARKVIADGGPRNVHRVAALDVAFVDRPLGRRPSLARAAVVVLSYPDLSCIEQHVVEAVTRFPYVPGLLSFRETPVLARVLAKVEHQPDLLLIDGHGRAHPRGFGIACHLGLLTDTPTIGVGKSRLHGTHDEPGARRGNSVPLLDGEETIGLVVRTREEVTPLYVSVGHRIALEAAAAWVLKLSTRYRLPEPIRLADRLSKGGSIP